MLDKSLAESFENILLNWLYEIALNLDTPT